MLLISCSLTAFAKENDISEEKDTLKQRFEDYMLSLREYYPDYYYDMDYWYWFKEDFSYFAPENQTDKPDYILFEGGFTLEGEGSCYEALDTYILIQYNVYTPNPVGLYLYSTTEDKIYNIASPEVDSAVTDAIIEEYLIPSHRIIVKLIGDADGDNDLTILDATAIQRIIAELCDPHPSDSLPEIGYPKKLACVSDMDRDGQRTILDATAIQRTLVGLDATEAE